MKFFTLEWWRGLQGSDYHDPIPDFQAHLATIRERLPPDLLALQETTSLHDSKIRETNYDGQLNTLEIRLDGDDGKGGLRQFWLRYSHVLLFRTVTDLDQGLPGPCGYGDLGYDEADIIEEGRFEHRLLFSTGIEFQIIFGGFDLEWRDVT